jgi:hypothetical protein
LGAIKNSNVSIMESKEEAVISKLLTAGYKDPRDDIHHLRSLQFTSLDGRRYRKFVKDFVYLDPAEVKTAQVRDQDYDDTYCKEQLKPLIESQGLKFVPHLDQRNNLETGHNRLPVMMELEPGKLLPFLRVSKPYLDNGDGTYSLHESDGFEDVIAKIKSNSPPPNNPYNMKSVAIQIKNLFKIDSTFRGLNPTGKWFEKNEGPFDEIMDDLHKDQFKSPGTRTKIRQEAGKGQSIIKPVQFSDWTHAATSIGWPSGVKVGTKRPSRMSFVEWSDSSDGTNITTVSTNGSKLKEKVSLELFEMFLDGTLGTTKGVKLLMKVNSPSSNPIALNKQRKDFTTEKIDALNKKLKARKFPEIKECFWVQQLNHPSDKGAHFVQSSFGYMEEK